MAKERTITCFVFLYSLVYRKSLEIGVLLLLLFVCLFGWFPDFSLEGTNKVNYLLKETFIS